MCTASAYTRRLLVPLWTLHIFFDLILIFAMIYLMLNTSGNTGKPIPASYDASFAFFSACIITEPLEVILHSFEVLKPWTYLAFQVGKALFWSIYLPIAIARPVGGERGTEWLVFIIVVIAVTLTYHASLVYAVVVFKRWRRTDRYGQNVQDEHGAGNLADLTPSLDAIVQSYADRASVDKADKKIQGPHQSGPPSYEDSTRTTHHASLRSSDSRTTSGSSLCISRRVSQPASPILR